MINRLRHAADVATDLFWWATYAIGLPLSPMLLALFVLSGYGAAVAYEDLLGGTEVYLLCITVFATTHVDLEKSKIDFSRLVMYRALKNLVFPSAVVIAMLFGVAFVNSFVSTCSACDFGAIAGTMEILGEETIVTMLILPKSHIAKYAVVLGIFTSLICGSLRLALIASEQSDANL